MGMKKVLGAAVMAFSLAGAGAAGAADPIKIGDINSYKSLPAHTIPYKQGAELAIEQINAKGGVLGRPLELISRDDQGKPVTQAGVTQQIDRTLLKNTGPDPFLDVLAAARFQYNRVDALQMQQMRK